MKMDKRLAAPGATPQPIDLAGDSAAYPRYSLELRARYAPPPLFGKCGSAKEAFLKHLSSCISKRA